MNRNEALDILWLLAQQCADEKMAGIQNLRDAINTLSSPCACIDAQEVIDWIEGMSTLDYAHDRAAAANHYVKLLRDRKPCACGGAKVLAEAKTTISEGWLLASVRFDMDVGGVDRPVRVLVFDDLAGGKPCS